MRILQSVPLALICLLGASAVAAPPKPVKNTCALVPVAEASKAVGTALKVGIELDGMCMYKNEKGSSVMMVSANSVDTVALASQSYQYAGKDSVKSVEPVPGVGDEAKITYSNSGPMMLVVRKGTTILLVSALPSIGPNLAGYKPGMIQVAKIAAGHL